MLGGILTVGGAAHLRLPAAWARAIVTALVTAAAMTVTPAAGASWCAAATTAGSSGCSITRRTIAATFQTH